MISLINLFNCVEVAIIIILNAQSQKICVKLPLIFVPILYNVNKNYLKVHSLVWDITPPPQFLEHSVHGCH